MISGPTTPLGARLDFLQMLRLIGSTPPSPRGGPLSCQDDHPKLTTTKTGSINDGSLFFTFPTRLSTGHMVIRCPG